MAESKSKPGDTVARKAFRTSRLAEFASISELEKATGQPVENWPLVVFKELADNAADEAEKAGVAPVVEIELPTVRSPSSTKAGHRARHRQGPYRLLDHLHAAPLSSPSRGQQGNALQIIIAMRTRSIRHRTAGRDREPGVTTPFASLSIRSGRRRSSAATKRRQR